MEPVEGEPGYSSYGLPGVQVGEFAVLLRDRIAASGEQPPVPPGQAREWDDADRTSFGFLLDMEESLPMLDDVVEDVPSRLPEIGRFHAALPFTDAEREWLLAKQKALWEPRSEHLRQIHAGTFSVKQRIVELGEEQHVAGADMVRRWAAWRRNADEFAENSSREDAAYALDKLAHELLPYGIDPELL
jgi:hypothetical protein